MTLSISQQKVFKIATIYLQATESKFGVAKALTRIINKILVHVLQLVLLDIIPTRYSTALVVI